MIETDEDLILFRYNGVEYEPVTIKKPNPPPKPPKPPRAPKAPTLDVVEMQRNLMRERDQLLQGDPELSIYERTGMSRGTADTLKSIREWGDAERERIVAEHKHKQEHDQEQMSPSMTHEEFLNLRRTETEMSCSMVTVRRTSTRFNGLEVTTSKRFVSLAEAKKRTRFAIRMCVAQVVLSVVAVSLGLWGTALLSSGFVMMFMWFASRGFKAQVAAMVSNSERVMAWLQGPGHGLSSFSEIMKGTKLSEPVLAETLTAMKASGEVIEDFDENAEKWLYSIVSEDENDDDLIPLSDRV